jgi:hypothetical protein
LSNMQLSLPCHASIYLIIMYVRMHEVAGLLLLHFQLHMCCAVYV